jgi:hypothetical protein
MQKNIFHHVTYVQMIENSFLLPAFALSVLCLALFLCLLTALFSPLAHVPYESRSALVSQPRRKADVLKFEINIYTYIRRFRSRNLEARLSERKGEEHLTLTS